jgi:hypothetical protein
VRTTGDSCAPSIFRKPPNVVAAGRTMLSPAPTACTPATTLDSTGGAEISSDKAEPVLRDGVARLRLPELNSDIFRLSVTNDRQPNGLARAMFFNLGQ